MSAPIGSDASTDAGASTLEAPADVETDGAESGADDGGPVAAFGPIERIQRSVPLPVVGGIVLVGAVALGVFIGRRR